jgi:tRNA pseudouridine38-40 synthase
MRYFIEVSYKGTNYSGFQIQYNANTVQAEVEKALEIFFKEKINLTGSSRTDAGVHALKNFFHFDYPKEIRTEIKYNLNAILPADIVIKNILRVNDSAHCRFDALSRHYKYFVHQEKNPFLEDRSCYFPYRIDFGRLKEAASVIREYTDFSSFSKRNTQVKTFQCRILDAGWEIESNCFVFSVKANRFLRGMVRGLTATMLNVGRHKTEINQFRHIIESGDCTKANFAVPAHGLFLIDIGYPENYF